MACTSCRRAPVWRAPSAGSQGNGTIIPRPANVNRAVKNPSSDQRSRITGLKYVPR